jgi:hypothetical protein
MRAGRTGGSLIENILERWRREPSIFWLTPADVDALVAEIDSLNDQAAEAEAEANRLDMELTRVRALNASLSPVETKHD